MDLFKARLELCKAIHAIEADSKDALAFTLFLTAYDLSDKFPESVYQGLSRYHPAYRAATIIMDFAQGSDFNQAHLDILISHSFNEMLKGQKICVDFLVNHI